MRFNVLIAAATLLMVQAPPATAQTRAAGDAVNGEAVWIKARCDSCHGTRGQGGPGGRIASRSLSAEVFTNAVRRGKISNPRANRLWAGMPPYSEKFISNPELTDLYAYLSSIPAPPPVSSIPLLAGDSARP